MGIVGNRHSWDTLSGSWRHPKEAIDGMLSGQTPEETTVGRVYLDLQFDPVRRERMW